MTADLACDLSLDSVVKKLQPPITDLISTTSAISLLYYECVHTCIIGNMLQGTTGDSLARTCECAVNAKSRRRRAGDGGLVRVDDNHDDYMAHGRMVGRRSGRDGGRGAASSEQRYPT
ncbi:hypothetical protein BDR05DRAFT_951760 [Suillus weaverae]|nr:hypothetical protein BDR05DRAFT_951760 [Suillus weaverae]